MNDINYYRKSTNLPTIFPQCPLIHHAVTMRYRKAVCCFLFFCCEGLPVFARDLFILGGRELVLGTTTCLATCGRHCTRDGPLTVIL